ncbi:hypothetical protein EHQ61_16400 [Leptospira wolffii]|uniref:hypothetical protein n=1 Tax=Leptospira wolffii TaxID=409998 RepID=UPI001082FCAA|nr:hypothetical protein [Leptospira wolffii]TGL46332.1 hypothetical protein EHQ61_16400 [Leptospira wolffii]
MIAILSKKSKKGGFHELANPTVSVRMSKDLFDKIRPTVKAAVGFEPSLQGFIDAAVSEKLAQYERQIKTEKPVKTR